MDRATPLYDTTPRYIYDNVLSSTPLVAWQRLSKGQFRLHQLDSTLSVQPHTDRNCTSSTVESSSFGSSEAVPIVLPVL